MKGNRKIIWISVGVVLLIGFSLAVFLLVRGIGRYNDAQGRFDVTLSEYRDLYDKSNPFPSRDNLNTERGNIDTIQGWIIKLVDELKSKQIDPDQQSKNPTSFINLLGEKLKAIQTAAKMSGTTMRDVKEGFAAGFEKYAQGGVLPAADDVPRLTQQITIVEQICSILFEEKIKELILIRRQEFDGAVTVSAPVPRATGGRRGGAASTRGRVNVKSASLANAYRVAGVPWSGEVKDAGEFRDKSLYTSMRFLVEFKAKESSILNIMNRFASSEMFMVVTSIDIETEPEAALDPATGTRVSGGAVAGDTNAPAVPAAAIKRRARKERLVFGPDLEKPATVRMEIEVYRFRHQKDAG